jgi:hypothetical protein
MSAAEGHEREREKERERERAMRKRVLISQGNKSAENMLAHHLKMQAFWRRYSQLVLANATYSTVALGFHQ